MPAQRVAYRLAQNSPSFVEVALRAPGDQHTYTNWKKVGRKEIFAWLETEEAPRGRWSYYGYLGPLGGALVHRRHFWFDDMATAVLFKLRFG